MGYLQLLFRSNSKERHSNRPVNKRRRLLLQALEERRVLTAPQAVFQTSEDGVMFGPMFANQTIAAVNVTLANSGGGKVDAWIDFDSDGVFEVAEEVLTNRSVFRGLQTINFEVPDDLDIGKTSARVRIRTDGGPSPIEMATDREFEVYQVAVRAPVDTTPVDTTLGNTSPGYQFGFDTSMNLLVGEPVELDINDSLTNTMNDATWTISGSSPAGFSVTERTGVVTWTPTPDQVGFFSVDVQATDGTNTETITVDIDVDSAVIDVTDAVFVAPDEYASLGTMDGTPQNPYSYDRLGNLHCKEDGIPQVRSGTVYFRGGSHTTDLGDNPASIVCSGPSLTNPLVLKPWGNERPILAPKGSYAMKLVGDNLLVEGLEVRGNLDQVSLQQTLHHWWEEGSPKTDGGHSIVGQGIQVEGAGTTVRNNVVWNMPGNGIRSGAGAWLVTIEDNVVFNTGWHSTRGVGGIGVFNLDDKPGEALPLGRSHGAIVRRNLVFGVQSRVISHVFSKGATKLEIDEGTAINVQQNGGDHTHGYLMEDNIIVWNGKGPGLRAIDVDFHNNTLYGNGSNLRKPSSAGVRAQNIQDSAGQGASIELIENAIDVPSNQFAINLLGDSTFAGENGCQGNLVHGAVNSNSDSGDISQCAVGAGGNLFVASEIFRDPVNLDFAPIVGSAGAPQAVIDGLLARVDELGFEVEENSFNISEIDDYAAYVLPMIDEIVSTVPGSPTLTYWTGNKTNLGNQVTAPNLTDNDTSDWDGIGVVQVEWAGTPPNYHTNSMRTFDNPYFLELNSTPVSRYSVQAIVTPAESGYVSCTEVSLRSNSGNRSSTCTAVPLDGHEFVAWDDGSANPILELADITSDVTLVASFRGPAPTDITLSVDSINENIDTTAADVIFAQLSSVDASVSDSHTYELVAGNGDADNTKFLIGDSTLNLQQNQIIDFEIQASYQVRVRSIDSGGLTFEKEITLSVNDLVEIAGVIFNNDATSISRSRIQTLAVEFDGSVTVDFDAFTLTNRTTDQDFGYNFDPPIVAGGKTVVFLQVQGPELDNGSLTDGNYELKIDATKVTSSTGSGLDAARDGTEGVDEFFGRDSDDQFYRLFGDASGDRSVGLSDFAIFRSTFGSDAGESRFDRSLDYNDDGSIGLSDFAAFRSAFGHGLDIDL